jgi:hypothetical protein
MTVVKKPSTSPENKVRRAKQAATHAINAAAVVAADSRQNRSTRTRGAYKLKADGLDLVARILSGKE